MYILYLGTMFVKHSLEKIHLTAMLFFFKKSKFCSKYENYLIPNVGTYFS